MVAHHSLLCQTTMATELLISIGKGQKPNPALAPQQDSQCVGGLVGTGNRWMRVCRKKLSTQTGQEEQSRPLLSKPPRRTYSRNRSGWSCGETEGPWGQTLTGGNRGATARCTGWLIGRNSVPVKSTIIEGIVHPSYGVTGVESWRFGLPTPYSGSSGWWSMVTLIRR